MDGTLAVTQEDAAATYTGDLFASTSSSASGTAKVALTATIQDISAVSPASDPNAGEIRNAVVTFVNRDNGDSVICSPKIALVKAGDTKTGTVTCPWNVNIGSSDSQSYTVGITVNGYYIRDDSADDVVITVSKPLSNYVFGSGYLVLSNSAGLKAGNAGTKSNFGFYVRYNKGGTSPQGLINVLVRRTESGKLHLYQIRSNSMTSFAVNTAKGTATVIGGANVQDITNRRVPVFIDGNAKIQMTMTDKGEPGSKDTLGITVWNKAGGLLFASKWDGTKTVEQLLGGGNLIVH